MSYIEGLRQALGADNWPMTFAREQLAGVLSEIDEMKNMLIDADRRAARAWEAVSEIEEQCVGAKIQPGDSWVVTFPESPVRAGTDRVRNAILDWAKNEGVWPPLVIFGGTVHIIDKENQT